MPIQRVELNTYYDVAIHCPFCGQLVVNDGESADGEIKACSHTLFFAHDEGFEYRSPEFDENLGLSDVPDDEIELPDHGYDGLTDQLTITDAIKFATYAGAPSGFGAYVGFAPKYKDD